MGKKAAKLKELNSIALMLNTSFRNKINALCCLINAAREVVRRIV
jgi:hypothetical protein